MRERSKSPGLRRILFPIGPLLVATIATSLPAQESSATAGSDHATPIAIIPLEAASRDQVKVTGGLQLTKDSAEILTSGTITSGSVTTSAVLPRRGVLRVCAATTVKLTADSSVPAGETPGLLMALEHGAIEASFAVGHNSDILLTPDFRILIGGPGSASEVKVRLGEHGDTCIDNPGANAPYVVVSGVFEGGAYRVQPGQRVMFQHGSIQSVVDQEKEPCGCPPPTRPNSNDFPLGQSAGLVPLSPAPAQPAPPVPAPPKTASPAEEALIYPHTAQPQEKTETANPPAASSAPATPAGPAAAPQHAAPQQKQGFFHSVGRFFKRIFGAE